ncbi:cytochrome bd ubiquinol oxidase subunit [Cylindrobasidium torrendii FP15055 ss-10]|uniref:Cytochrome b-c1 complex subunit 7 n=1 Tax=Cylindrobasidium torrendii FP15055 ss-10 TaxID=1314674 RepID=A0A0D7BIE7_9AGAR|nr:cytochrome bd ubiquinol oxidase subunit [Cylindrobasidium torrendii FP15055 ss-10]
MFGPLGFSLAPQIRASRTLSKWFLPFSKWYTDRMGYRKFGLKYDDLLVEEREDVQRALGRLTQEQSYDRAFRMKRSIQSNVLRKELPKEEWLPESQDVRYLKPHVLEVAKEDTERAYWDNLSVQRQK